MSQTPSAYPDDSTREYHPAVEDHIIWPDAEGYPPSQQGLHLWTREGLLRQAGEQDLLAMWTTGGPTEPWIGNRTIIRRSADGGKSWTEAGTFTHPSRGLFTTELFVAPDHSMHAFINTYDVGVWMTQLLSYRAISHDGGLTWNGPHSIPGGLQNVWPNRGIRHSSGRWIIPVSWAEIYGAEWAAPSVGFPPVRGQVGLRELEQELLPYGADVNLQYPRACDWSDRNHRYVCGAMLSDDEGQTFRLRGYLRGGAHGHLLEPRVVELADGRVVMLLRAQRDGRLWRSESADGGETWPAPVRSEIPNPGAKVNILRATDGRIFLLHNPSEDSGVAMVGRNPLSLWVSEDDMQTWPVRVDLIRDRRPRSSLNYPDGFLDEKAGMIRFLWEDTYAVHFTSVPMDIR
jgi:hypothetical protein